MSFKDRPFYVGDKVKMMHRGFAMDIGEEGYVTETTYVTGVGWCMTVVDDNGRHHRYRSVRFKIAEEGDMRMKPFYIIYETYAEEDGTRHIHWGINPLVKQGSEADLKDYLKALLAANPNKTYAYGLINRVVQTDTPPIKIINL